MRLRGPNFKFPERITRLHLYIVKSFTALWMINNHSGNHSKRNHVKQFCASWVVLHDPGSCFGLLVRGAKATSCVPHVAERKWRDYSKSMIWVLQTDTLSNNNCFKKLLEQKSTLLAVMKSRDMGTKSAVFLQGLKKKKKNHTRHVFSSGLCAWLEFTRN